MDAGMESSPDRGRDCSRRGCISRHRLRSRIGPNTSDAITLGSRTVVAILHLPPAWYQGRCDIRPMATRAARGIQLLSARQMQMACFSARIANAAIAHKP